MSNWNTKVIYVGVTNNLERRIYEHKNKMIDGFTKKYNLTKLVYYEMTSDVNAAIRREKEIKKWRREKKRVDRITEFGVERFIRKWLIDFSLAEFILKN